MGFEPTYEPLQRITVTAPAPRQGRSIAPLCSINRESCSIRELYATLQLVPPNPVIEVLAKLSAAKLEAMQKDIEAQIADLRTQARWVDHALVEKGVHPPTTPQNGASSPTPAPAPAPNAPKRRSTKRTGTAALIRTVIKERPEHVWTPMEIIRTVQARGATSSPAAIRVALRRMHNVEHFVERGPDNTGWRLASSNGSGRESFSEAPNRDPVGMGGNSPPAPTDGSG